MRAASRSARNPALASGAVAVVLLGGIGAGAAQQPASSRHADMFDRLPGRWAGAGTAGAFPSAAEAVRCRVQAFPAGADRLHLVLACAGTSAALRIEAELVRRDGRVEGTLVESRSGIAGTLAGSASGDRLDATVTGLGLSGMLTMTLRGRVAAVSLNGTGPIAAAGAAVTLRRL